MDDKYAVVPLFKGQQFYNTSDGHMAAEASSLGIAPGKVFRQIAIDWDGQGNNVARYNLTWVSKDDEGDIRTWKYGESILIFND